MAAEASSTMRPSAEKPKPRSGETVRRIHLQTLSCRVAMRLGRSRFDSLSEIECHLVIRHLAPSPSRTSCPQTACLPPALQYRAELYLGEGVVSSKAKSPCRLVTTRERTGSRQSLRTSVRSHPRLNGLGSASSGHEQWLTSTSRGLIARFNMNPSVYCLTRHPDAGWAATRCCLV